jgi:hydrogenase nickel incorporation protein HypA/HybF
MHEFSICQALISQVGEIARLRAAQVRQVRVGIGPLSGVEPQLLESVYPLACIGTAAEGSHLEIEQTKVRVGCRGCGAQTVAAPNRLVCAACGDWHTDLLGGDELLLLQVEIDTSEGDEEVSRV